MGRDWTSRIKMNDLSRCMNTGIGPACGYYRMGYSRLQLRQSLF
jgi:hypothetical protein